ncbi:MAG: hypothetical protein LBS67_00475 [Clostridiales Family XIII bacterium]|jgi:hypothetical protein|nr:hypothetical protein [Clostridiales Family XIII bacterium]
MINAPTCTTTSGATNDANGGSDNSGRLVWTGTQFNCQRITDTIAGNYGNNTKTKAGATVTLANIPVITVDAYGEVSFSQVAVNVSEGNGIDISAEGAFSVELATSGGLAFNGTGLALMQCDVGYSLVSTGTNTWGCSADKPIRMLKSSLSGWTCSSGHFNADGVSKPTGSTVVAAWVVNDSNSNPVWLTSATGTNTITAHARRPVIDLEYKERNSSDNFSDSFSASGSVTTPGYPGIYIPNLDFSIPESSGLPGGAYTGMTNIGSTTGVATVSGSVSGTVTVKDQYAQKTSGGNCSAGDTAPSGLSLIIAYY